MNLKEMPDSEFQELLEALPSFNWDLAVKLEGLPSVSEVPDSLWDEFIEFYKDYHSPKPTKKERTKEALRIILSMIALGVFVLFVLPWGIENIYPAIPAEVKNLLEPIFAFAVRFRIPIKILILIGIFSSAKDQLKNN